MMEKDIIMEILHLISEQIVLFSQNTTILQVFIVQMQQMSHCPCFFCAFGEIKGKRIERFLYYQYATGYSQTVTMNIQM